MLLQVLCDILLRAKGERGVRKVLQGVLVALVLLVVSFGLGFLIGKGVNYVNRNHPKTYNAEGLNITLPGGFVENRDNSITQAGSFSSEDVSIVVIRDAQSFENYSELSEYAKGVQEANQYENEATSESGYTFFERTTTIGSVKTRNVLVVMKGPDAYWMLRFSFDEAAVSEYRPKVFEWLNTVTFDE